MRPTWFYQPSFYRIPIRVTRVSPYSVSDYFRNALRVERESDISTIVNIALRDPSPIRAADVINEVVRVYNEDAVNDKKRIIAYTYDYINERIAMIHSDLGTQESALASFKRENLLLDVNAYGQAYLNASMASSEEVSNLKKQLSLARYLLQQIEVNDGN